MRYLSLLILMISTSLVFLTVQHLSQTTQDIHAPSIKVKSVMDIPESVEIPTIKPLNSNILTLNTLAPEFTLIAKESTKRLPDTSQKALDSKTVYIQALKNVVSKPALTKTQKAKSVSHSLELALGANNAHIQTSESQITRYAHFSTNVNSPLETTESVNAITINPLNPSLYPTEDVIPPAPKSIEAVITSAPKSSVAETKILNVMPHTSKSGLKFSSSYINALKSVTSSRRSVLLALVDQAYATMAVNFFLTSIRPYNIENYLILTMNSETCKFIKTYGVKNCFQYRNFSSANASKFGSKEFNDKMNIRTDMILEALEADITVLHSDTDVKFFQNPFKTVPRLCPISKCDIIALKDVEEYNAGFLLINPTEKSKKSL